jgi:hypothetical protein
MTSARGEERTITEGGGHLADSILKMSDIDRAGSGEADLRRLQLGRRPLSGQHLVVPDQRTEGYFRSIAKTAGERTTPEPRS